MKIYTSYFAKSKELKEHGVTVISIARYSPRFVSCVSLKEVAPTPEILSMKMNPIEYTRRYEKEVLAQLNIAHVLREISRLSDGHDVALCCYEKGGQFCHRHLLADYLREHGIPIEEWRTPSSTLELDLFERAEVAQRKDATLSNNKDRQV